MLREFMFTSSFPPERWVRVALSVSVTSLILNNVSSPEKVNTDPYGDGWMIKIEITDQSEITDLLDSGAYKELIGQ